MAGEPLITVVGNLAGDPELRFTSSGHAVANLTIAQTPRRYDQQQQQWIDDETLWVRGTVWREYAENVAETLHKGMHVMALGRLQARSFEDKHGNQRTKWELQIEDIGPTLRWATAQVQRVQRGGNNAGANPWGNSQYNQPPQTTQNNAQGQWGAAPQGGGFGQVPPGDNAWGGSGSWDQGNDSPPPF